MIDLHVHSICSDGSLTPSELVHLGIEKGLTAFALTDHDSTAGLAEAMEAAKGKPIEVIPGIELSTEYEGKDIHIVGLYIDPEETHFKTHIQEFVDSRVLRNQKMCQKLSEAGVDITYEDLIATYPDSVITRAHYGQYIMAKGYAKSMAEVFDRYIGDHAPCFIPREKVTPAQAVELILKAGGIPILAHPILYHMSDSRLEKLVQELKAVGLVGIEAIYSTYTAGEENQIQRLANQYNLAISGGSDFHGKAKPKLEMGTGYGGLQVPDSVLWELKKEKNWVMFSDIDGTLIRKDGSISATMLKTIQEFLEKGNIFVLSSGRPLESILQVKESIALPDHNVYVVANNGTQIYDCEANELLWEERLSMDFLQKIFAEAKAHGIHIHSFSDTEVITTENGKEMQFYMRKIKMPLVVTDNPTEKMDKPAFKALAVDLEDKSRLEAFRDHILQAYPGQCQAEFSNEYYLEFFSPIGGKGNGLRKFCELLQISPAFSMAAGDAENDISMVKAAAVGVAMANGDLAVKEAADFTTTASNEEDGLIEAWKKFIFK